MGNGASDPHRITESFPDLYADSRGQQELLIDNLCTIVQKQINWKLKQKNGDHVKHLDDKYNNNFKYMPCNEDDISFMINNFFTLRPYRPIKSKRQSFSATSLNKNWIYATLYIYDIFEEYSPFKMNYLIQNEWINQVFICSSHICSSGSDMDLYCCQLIDIMMKCWGAKNFTKYRFNDKNNRHKIHQFIEFKSFYLLNHCLNKKNYLKSFKTTPKNVKIYIYKIIENIQVNPSKNRGSIAIKLIEWFMSKRLINNQNDYENNKYKITFIDLLKIVVLRIVILKKKYKNTHSDKIEMAILELNTLLTKLKKIISDRKLLEKQKYTEILHNEIMSLTNTNNNTPFSPQISKKLLSETEVLEFIKIITELHPNCLFHFSAFENGGLTPLDLAKKYNLKQIIIFLEIAMNENKYILNDSSCNPSSENEQDDHEEIYTSNSSVHELFKNTNININTTPNSCRLGNKYNQLQFLKLKSAKTLPQKSTKITKHNHSKSDLLNEIDFGNRRLCKTPKKRRSYNHEPPKQYIDYLMTNKPPSNRKNAVDFGDDIDTNVRAEVIKPKNVDEIYENPYYIVDEPDDDNDMLFIVTKGNINVTKEKANKKQKQKPKQIPFDKFNEFITMGNTKTINNNNTFSKQNELESRIEVLENENIILKSDVRSLKHLVRDLTNTMQQLIQVQTLHE